MVNRIKPWLRELKEVADETVQVARCSHSGWQNLKRLLHGLMPVTHDDLDQGTLRYMISYIIYNNYDIAYDIICLVMSMI